MKKYRFLEKFIFISLSLPVTALILCFLWILVSIGVEGVKSLSWKFLITSVMDGGIFESIVGTLYMLGGAVTIATPIGVATAVYLAEYAKGGKIARIIIQAIHNIAGIPSIIFGLFGYTFFCTFLGFGISLLSGWLTLACMILPIIVSGSYEAISMVPLSFKKAAIALGASKLRVIRDVVIPTAAPGIATSIILGISRVAGETAAILFTSCVYLTNGLPSNPLQPVMTLTYNLFGMLVATPRDSLGDAFAMALVLLMIVIVLNTFAYFMRIYYRRRWNI